MVSDKFKGYLFHILCSEDAWLRADFWWLKRNNSPILTSFESISNTFITYLYTHYTVKCFNVPLSEIFAYTNRTNDLSLLSIDARPLSHNGELA